MDEAPLLPVGATLDLRRIRNQLDRHLERRGKQVDRFDQLALTPGRRQISRDKPNSNCHVALPGDPPAIQLLIALADELESGDWKEIDDLSRRAQARNQLMKQMGDLISSQEDKHTQTFKEYCALIDQHMRKSEHDDKMRVAQKLGDADLSDADLIRMASEKGIPLVSDEPEQG